MDVTISIIKKSLAKEGINSDRIDFLMTYLADRQATLENFYIQTLKNTV